MARAPAPAPYSGPALHEGQPQVGFYWRRLVRNGPRVPVRIHRTCLCTPCDTSGGFLPHEWSEACDRSGVLRAEVDGREVDPREVWLWCCENRITEDEYRLLRAQAQWAREWAPERPEANPTRQVNLAEMRPILMRNA